MLAHYPEDPSKWLSAVKASYTNNGYVVIPALWPAHELSGAVQALETLLDSANSHPDRWREQVLWQADVPASQLAGIPTGQRAAALEQIYIVGDVAAHSPVLKAMILDPRCIHIARQLLDDEVVCHFSNATIRAAQVGCACNWHRDWPNTYCTTGSGRQLRLMVCLDGMQEGQGATRVIPGSHEWDQDRFEHWHKHKQSPDVKGEALVCPPGSVVVLGPTIVHGAEPNLSPIPRRNLIAQWGGQSDFICLDTPESMSGYVPLS